MRTKRLLGWACVVLLVDLAACGATRVPSEGNARPSASSLVGSSRPEAGAQPDKFEWPEPVKGPFPSLEREWREVKLPGDLGVAQIAASPGRVWALAGDFVFELAANSIRERPTCEVNGSPSPHRQLTATPGGAVLWTTTPTAVVVTHVNDTPPRCVRVVPGSIEALQMAIATRPQSLSLLLKGGLGAVLGEELGNASSQPVVRLFSHQSRSLMEVFTESSSGFLHAFLMRDGAWVRVRLPKPSVGDIWVGPQGELWVLVGVGPVLAIHPPPRKALLTAAGTGWQAVRTPAHFNPSRMAGSPSGELWFVGDAPEIWRFDGTNWYSGTLVRSTGPPAATGANTTAEAPVQVQVSDDGAVWVLAQGGRLYRANP